MKVTYMEAQIIEREHLHLLIVLLGCDTQPILLFTFANFWRRQSKYIWVLFFFQVETMGNKQGKDGENEISEPHEVDNGRVK